MVVEAGEKLHLFGAGAMVDGIVKDEHVNAICMSQGSERVIDDGGGNLCREWDCQVKCVSFYRVG